MKTYNKYIALAALALAACTQDENFAPQSSDIVQIASAHIATEVQTRVNTAGNADAFEADDEILLINTTRTNKNKGTYTFDGEAWTPATGLVLWTSGTNTFEAFYPAIEEFTLPTDQSDENKLKSADRMEATATATKGSEVSLSFSHQNAKVTITTKMNGQYDETTATVSNFTIDGVKPYIANDAYTAILEPTENGFTVNLTVDGDELTATSSSFLDAGMHYTFTLYVGKEKATFGAVTVEEWGTTTPLTGGEATEIQTENDAIIARFMQLFFDENGAPKIVQLEGEEDGTTWYANVESGNRVIELFNLVTGMNIEEQPEYRANFTSSDQCITMNIEGTILRDDEAIFAVMDLVLPGFPEIRRIIFVHEDFFNGTN